MSAHAEALISIMSYLESLDRQIAERLRSNRAHVRRANACVADTLSQIAYAERRDTDAVFRKNGTFFPEL